MPNTTDNLDIKPVLDKILKKLEKLDAIELTLRDVSSRLTRAETVVEKLERRDTKDEFRDQRNGYRTHNFE